MQPSHTSLGTDLVAVARGFGIAATVLVAEVAGADEVAERVRARGGTTFVRVLVTADEPPRALPPRDGVGNKNAFRAALGLPTF
jgi:phosphonopyruvate decarboxylase